MASCRGTLVWQSFDGVTPSYNVHQWNSRNLAYPAAELAITGSDNKATVGGHSLYETIVSIGTSV